MRSTLQQIMAKYGAIAVVIYLTIFTLVLGGSYFAIRLGWAPTSIASNAGIFTAAYLFTKLTQPLRIAATAMLTPIVGRLWRRGAEPPASSA
ncbi:MAG: hypothetical protein H0U59_08300 [Gemmatimonadaceae bacterium]|nr:hypothetical protein [Gemmatimonadaceae bacterium]